MLYLLNRNVQAGGTVAITNNVLYDIVNGNLSNLGGWLVGAGVVVVSAAFFWRRDYRRRRTGLAAPPVGLTVLKIVAVALSALVVVLVGNTDRGRAGISLTGVPWEVPDPDAVYLDLGPRLRAAGRRPTQHPRPRPQPRAPRRKVTLEPTDPDTGQLAAS